MKKIRQHNDIDISVVIKNTEGEILDPSLCKGIQIRVQTNGNETQIAHYDIFEDGHIVFRFNAKDQTQIGVYDIVISATTTDGRVFTTDVCKAFCIVPCTCCTDNEPGEVDTETLEVEATIEITSWGYMYDKRVEDIEKNYSKKSDSIDVTPLFTIGGTMNVRGMYLLQSHLYVQTENYLSNVTVTVGSHLYLLEAQRRSSTVDYGLVSVMSVVKFTDGVPECVDVVNADSKDAELLKRIQGTSEDSRASTDPFVRMDFRNIGELNDMLDTMHNDAEDRGKYMGVFRGTVDGGPYILENIVRNYANDVWEQCIRGCYNINSEKPKELIASNKYRILRRSFYEGKWGAWENLFPTDIPTSGESYGKKVILLGDSQIAMCKNGSLTLEGMLKEKLNTEVYNFAFAGSRWTLRSDSVASIYNPFSINEVVKALVESNYADMDNVISNATDSDFIASYKKDYESTVERMEASNIDLNYGEYVVVIACGGNDFKQAAPWGTVNDEVQDTLFGAMNSALKQLSYFSGVSVCVVSPTFTMMGDKTSDEETVGGKYRYEVGDAILAHARDAFHLSTFDMYRRGGRNKYNITSLCPDGVHPNSEAGVKSTVSLYEKILKSFGGSWPSTKTINGQSILGYGDITISGGGSSVMSLSGKLNLTDKTAVQNAQKTLANTNEIAYYLITDNEGKIPSNVPCYRVPEDVATALGCSSPHTITQSALSLLNISLKGFGVNVGDLIALTRVKVKVSDLASAIGKDLSILGNTEIEIYQYKILSTNDAKPYGYNDIAEGVAGLMSPWDKVQVNGIKDIAKTAGEALPKNDLLPSRWEANMNNALQTGVYTWCTLGRPSGSTGAYTCIVKRTSTSDGAYNTIEQTAYGREAELGQVYKRIIFEKTDGTDTQFGEWVRVSNEGVATKDDVASAISEAITKTLNTEV